MIRNSLEKLKTCKRKDVTHRLEADLYESLKEAGITHMYMETKNTIQTTEK